MPGEFPRGKQYQALKNTAGNTSISPSGRKSAHTGRYKNAEVTTIETRKASDLNTSRELDRG